MLKDKIYKYQEIIVNGNDLYITGESEVINAKQFFRWRVLLLFV